MQVVKDEVCPKCGGIILLIGQTLQCSSCDYATSVTDKKTLKRVEEAVIKVNTNIQLTKTGEWLFAHDLFEMLEMRRLALNMKEGYQLRAIDCFKLTEAGFAEGVINAPIEGV